MVISFSEPVKTSKFYLDEPLDNMVTTATTGKEAEPNVMGGNKGSSNEQTSKNGETQDKKKKSHPDGTQEYTVRARDL